MTQEGQGFLGDTDLPFGNAQPDPLQEEVMEDIPLVSTRKERRVYEPGYYLAEIIAAGVVNNNWYDPSKDSPEAAKKVKVVYKFQYEGEEVEISQWLAISLFGGGNGRKSSHLHNLLTALKIDPLSSPKPSELVGKKVKIGVKKVTKDNGEKINRVDGEAYSEA